MRTTYLATAAALALLLAACGSTSDDDQGVDVDLGMISDDPDDGVDQGGELPDMGSDECQVGCEIVELVAGSNHTCGRRENGEVLCWGRNREGQLGDGRTRHSAFMCPDERGERTDCSGTPVVVVGVDDFTQLSAGAGFTDIGHSTCGLRESGEVWCWGFEPIGETTGDNVERRLRPERDRTYDDEAVTLLSQGSFHQCALVGADREVWCYGNNSRGQLGLGDQDPRFAAEPVTLDGEGGPAVISNADEIHAAKIGSYTCALVAGEVYCWGINNQGQLGAIEVGGEGSICRDGDLVIDCTFEPTQVTEEMPLSGVTSLSLGSAHACALDGDGALRCWGDNRAGQGGSGDAGLIVGPTPVEGLPEGAVAQTVQAMSRSTCALLTDGRVFCWGFNFNGQLGDGVTDHGEICEANQSDSGDCSRTPVQVVDEDGPIDDATFLGAGLSHACVLRGDDNRVFCWGRGTNRQLGPSTGDDSSIAIEVPIP